MRVSRCLWGLVAMAAVWAGCGTTATITNLTPRQQTRNSQGLYPVEVEFNSNMAALRPESVRPYVQVGVNNYPMRRTPLLPARWETLLPVPVESSVLNYRVKVDFEYNGIPVARSNSALSAPFQLQVRDPR